MTTTLRDKTLREQPVGAWTPVSYGEKPTEARKIVEALERRFGTARSQEIEPVTASEDFGLFGAAWDVPAVFRAVGGIDPDRYAAAEKAGERDALPARHAPDLAPAIHPTLRTGVEAMLAAGVWLVTSPAHA